MAQPLSPSSIRSSCSLYRALENGGSTVTGESLVDDVNTSLVYFEDRYGVGVDRVLVTGVQASQVLQEALSASSSTFAWKIWFPAPRLVRRSANVPRSALAGVVGALVS